MKRPLHLGALIATFGFMTLSFQNFAVVSSTEKNPPLSHQFNSQPLERNDSIVLQGLHLDNHNLQPFAHEYHLDLILKQSHRTEPEIESPAHDPHNIPFSGFYRDPHELMRAAASGSQNNDSETTAEGAGQKIIQLYADQKINPKLRAFEKTWVNRINNYLGFSNLTDAQTSSNSDLNSLDPDNDGWLNNLAPKDLMLTKANEVSVELTNRGRLSCEFTGSGSHIKYRQNLSRSTGLQIDHHSQDSKNTIGVNVSW